MKSKAPRPFDERDVKFETATVEECTTITLTHLPTGLKLGPKTTAFNKDRFKSDMMVELKTLVEAAALPFAKPAANVEPITLTVAEEVDMRLGSQ
jgi:hypothetical protein